MNIKNINLIKSIGIFLVIINHFGVIDFNYINNNLTFNSFLLYRSLLGVGVGLLLVCSGYLVIEKNYSLKKILNKVLLLILLLFVYKILYGVILNINSLNINSLVYLLTTSGSLGYRSNSLWFMYAYISIYLLLPFISMMYKNNKIYIYFCILVLAYCFGLIAFEQIFNANHKYKMQLFQTLYPLNTHYIFALGYFLIGGLIKKYEVTIKNLNINTIILLSCLLLNLTLQSFYSIYLTNTTHKLFDPMYDGYTTIFNVLNVLILFYYLAYKLKKIEYNLINLIACYSLGIYLLHWPITKILKENHLTIFTNNIYFNNIILSIIIVGICLILSILLSKSKYTKWLIKI